MLNKAKISDYLRQYVWLLKPCIWLIIIIWAGQASLVAKINKGRNWPLEIEVAKMLEQQSSKIFEAAKATKDYGPKQYFRDLREMDALRFELRKKYPNAEINPGYTQVTFQLQDIVRRNIDIGKFPASELDRYRKEYSNWLIDANAKRPETFNQTNCFQVLDEIFNWAKVLYFRSLILFLGLYLITMFERDGIVRTILSDKWRFLLAIFLWPAYFFRYPSYVIREMVVEAELRRIGSAFRKLTGAERRQIQILANSKQYRSWLQEHRLLNSSSFQRGFFVALLIVILIHCCMPRLSVAMAFEDEARAGPVITMQFVQADIHVHILEHALQDVCMQAEFFVEAKQTTKAVQYFVTTEKWDKIFAYEIDHVPLQAVRWALVD